MKTYKKLLTVLLFVLVIGMLVSCGESYKVSFDAENETAITTKTVDKGNKVTPPVEPTKTGYEFAGWFVEGEEEPFDFTKGITKNLTLIGHWDILAFTITFDSQGGSSVDNVTVNYNGVILKPENPTKDNFNFKGWYIDGTLYDFNVPVTKDLNLVAQWEAEYMVIYNFNYDSKKVEVSETPGELVNALEVENREGYTFGGWFKNNSFTRPFDFEEELMPYETLNLYAKWDSVPVITGIGDFTHYIGDDIPDLMEGVTATDALDGTLSVTLIEGSLDFSKVGEYNITYKAENLSGTITSEVVKITVEYLNRVVIKDIEPQKGYIQVNEEILGFYLELTYEGTLVEAEVVVSLNDWISDIYVSDGVIKIVATGLVALDAYLLTEIFTVNKDVNLTVTKITVDTISENGVIIK